MGGSPSNQHAAIRDLRHISAVSVFHLYSHPLFRFTNLKSLNILILLTTLEYLTIMESSESGKYEYHHYTTMNDS